STPETALGGSGAAALGAGGAAALGAGEAGVLGLGEAALGILQPEIGIPLLLLSLLALKTGTSSADPSGFQGGVRNPYRPHIPPAQPLPGKPVPNQGSLPRPAVPLPGNLPQDPTAGTPKPTTGTLGPNSGIDVPEDPGSAI